MRGFIDENNSYYEADNPLSANDIPVPLRPSDQHTLGPNAQWILDRRAANRQPTIREYAEQAYRQRSSDRMVDTGPDSNFGSQPMAAPSGRYPPTFQQPSPLPMGYPYQQQHHQSVPQPQAPANADNAVRQTLFEFVARNWLPIISALVWMVGSSWVVAKQFYDMQAVQERQTESIKNLQEELKVVKAEAKEQKDKNELLNKSNDSRYNDLNLFLQTIAARKQP